MPIHDWSRVGVGVFHDFHHAWIEQIKEVLNVRILPPDYYALAERHSAGFGSDVLTLHEIQYEIDLGDLPSLGAIPTGEAGESGLQLFPPKVRLAAETDMEFYRRKQTTLTVRHVSGDRIVAMVEIVSPGNKSSRLALRKFIEKTVELLDREIHLLILDLHPPGPRDPQGIHGAIWEEITDQHYAAPLDKDLTLVAYESGLIVRAYVEPVAVGDILPEMPLFLQPGGHILVPLEATYQAAWETVPRRWRGVIEGQRRGGP
jgi:hypothetical protein